MMDHERPLSIPWTDKEYLEAAFIVKNRIHSLCAILGVSVSVALFDPKTRTPLAVFDGLALGTTRRDIPEMLRDAADLIERRLAEVER